MRQAVIRNGVVENVIEVDGEFVHPDAQVELRPAGEAGPGWTFDGETYAPPPEPEPPAPTMQDYQAAIDAHVEATAAARGYGSATLSATLSIATYIASSNPLWAGEAAIFVAWRDAVWVHAFAKLGRVETGEVAQPTIEGFIAGLPPIEWPDDSDGGENA